MLDLFLKESQQQDIPEFFEALIGRKKEKHLLTCEII